MDKTGGAKVGRCYHSDILTKLARAIIILYRCTIFTTRTINRLPGRGRARDLTSKRTSHFTRPLSLAHVLTPTLLGQHGP